MAEDSIRIWLTWYTVGMASAQEASLASGIDLEPKDSLMSR